MFWLVRLFRLLKEMGSIDATVNLVSEHPAIQHVVGGIISSRLFYLNFIGTSVGTLVALVPIAAGIAHSTEVSIPLVTAIIVGGAYFGDNLSFISGYRPLLLPRHKAAK